MATAQTRAGRQAWWKTRLRSAIAVARQRASSVSPSVMRSEATLAGCASTNRSNGELNEPRCSSRLAELRHGGGPCLVPQLVLAPAGGSRPPHRRPCRPDNTYAMRPGRGGGAEHLVAQLGDGEAAIGALIARRTEQRGDLPLDRARSLAHRLAPAPIIMWPTPVAWAPPAQAQVRAPASAAAGRGI